MTRIASIPLVISAVSLLLSLTVAWLTLLRRGNLGMTRPMLLGFLHEDEQPKIFLRAMLYATGKRGHIIEALYIKVQRGESSQMFNFWVYGETGDLKVGSGLRVGEDGVSVNHHFLPPRNDSGYVFTAGDYVIQAYARTLNRKKPLLLYSVELAVNDELAEALRNPANGALFTWWPDSQTYQSDVSEPVGGGRSRSVSGASGGKLPWA